MRYQLSKAGENFIKGNEGLSLTLYPDGKGLTSGYSVGYGHYIPKELLKYYALPSGGYGVTKEQAESLFLNDVSERVEALNKVLTVEISQPFFDALIDLSFSFSPAAFKDSSLIKLINSGAGRAEIEKAWINYYIKYGGDLNYAPLVQRRKKEIDLAFTPVNKITESIGIDYLQPHELFFIGILSMLVILTLIYLLFKK